MKIAKECLSHEARAILDMSARIDKDFLRAVQLIYRAKGPAILIGMGKPFFIAQKISASLASTGTYSFPLHPADALHGDLGRITKHSVLIVLSNSGETPEITQLLPSLRQIGCRTIAITGNTRSSLARFCDVVLDTSVREEAPPLNIAPTASTTCMLAMGDALTMALVKMRKFKVKDFALLHPGGSLGRKLSVKVKDVMRTGLSLVCVLPSASLKDVLLQITSSKSGSAVVINKKKECLGIFTDGDLRRHFSEASLHTREPIHKFMTAKPITIYEEMLASQAVLVFKQKRVDELPVLNASKKVTGMLDIQDLVAQGFSA